MTERDVDECSQALAAYLQRNPDTQWLDAICVDLCGAVRGKRFPIEDADKLFTNGMTIPASIYYLDATGECGDPCGLGFSDGDPDALAWPLTASLAPTPWSDVASAQVMLSMVSQSRWEP